MNSERFWQNLDKFMLFGLFLICIGVSVSMHYKSTMDEGSLDWARHNTDLVLAGLLGLMGGRAMANRTTANHSGPSDNPSSPGTPPVDAPASLPTPPGL